MLKTAKCVAIAGATLALVACAGGTPECGSSDIQRDLRELADARIAQAVNNDLKIPQLNTREELDAAIKERLSYDFGSIRTTTHDESTDTFQCASTLVVSVKGSDQSWERAFDYEVYSVEDADTDYKLAYDERTLEILRVGAGEVLQQIAMAAENKVTGPRVLRELQEVRDAGQAGTQREREILESLNQRGLEAPAVTEAQRQRALEEMQRYEDPRLFYSEVPREILDQVEARRAQASEAQRKESDEEAEARRLRCAAAIEPALDPNCRES